MTNLNILHASSDQGVWLDLGNRLQRILEQLPNSKVIDFWGVSVISPELISESTFNFILGPELNLEILESGGSWKQQTFLVTGLTPDSPELPDLLEKSIGVLGIVCLDRSLFNLLQQEKKQAYHFPFFFESGAANPFKDLDIVISEELSPSIGKVIAKNSAIINSFRSYLYLEEGGASSKANYSQAENALSRARVTCNLQGGSFSWHKYLKALEAGTVYVTSPCANYEPLVPGKHFIMADKRVLFEVIDFYLKDNTAISDILVAATDECIRLFAPAYSASNFFTAIFSGQSESRSEAMSGTTTSSKFYETELRLISHLRLKLNGSNAKLDDQVEVLNTASKEQIAQRQPFFQELGAKRMAFEGRQRIERALEDSGVLPYEIMRNSKASDLKNVDVSVVITVFNYEPYLRKAVESIISQKSREYIFTSEIVIVDDCSTDGSHALAVNLLNEFPDFPITILKKKLNTGYVRGRNYGVRESRGEYILILDADNYLLPNCIEPLFLRAKFDRSIGAYGIIGCFSEVGELRGNGLLSSHTWDVGKLLEMNYIDAMSIIKRDYLICVNGFDEDLADGLWHGWEDYEFWLRAAYLGNKMSFYPSVVAMYRESNTSMINTTNFFADRLAKRMKTKFASLVEKYSDNDVYFGFTKDQLPYL